MTERGPRARLHEFAGVGHAPTLVSAEQIAVVREFLLGAMKTHAAGCAATRRRRAASSNCSTSARRRGTASRRRSVARARAPSPSRCWPAARSTPARTRWRMPTASPQILRGIGAAPSMRAAAYLVYAGDYLQQARRGGRPRPSAPSYASLVDAHAQAGADPARRARGAGRRGAARAADRARAQDAAGVLARPARRAAAPGLAAADAALRSRPASTPCPRDARARVAAGVRAAGQPARHLADQVGARGPVVPLPRARGLPGGRAAARRASASSASSASRRCAGSLGDDLARARHRAPRCRAGPSTSTASGRRCTARGCDFDARVRRARAARDRRRRAGLLRGAGPRARAVPRGRRRVRRLHRPAQGQRLPVAAHRRAGRATAARSRCRSAPARCTSTPSTASPRTGPTRRPARRAMPASAPPATSRTRVAEARKAVLRQLLAWERDFVASRRGRARPPAASAVFDDRIYVFTPQAAVVELPAGATPVDFAYALHTDLGHRCRGAQGRRRDGAAEHAAAERPDGRGHRGEGAAGRRSTGSTPSSATCRARARAGQGARLVQRAGAGADDRARPRGGREAAAARGQAPRSSSTTSPARLGFKSADALFEVVGKDEFSLRNIENLLRPAEPAPTADDAIALRRAAAAPASRAAAACWWSASTRC